MSESYGKAVEKNPEQPKTTKTSRRLQSLSTVASLREAGQLELVTEQLAIAITIFQMNGIRED